MFSERINRKLSDKKEKNCRLGVVGGQAVLEGVMMKHKDKYSVAVRKEDGSVTVQDGTFVSVRKKHKICNIPIVRGVVNMIEMLMLSIKTLDTSARLYGIEEEVEESKFEKWLKKHFGKGIVDFVMLLAMILGVALSVFLFIFLPSFITKLIDGLADGKLGLWRNLIEGGLKVVIFVCYLLLCLLMKDIRRTFEYHGAEHKSIFCYEAGEELTPENVKKYKRFHPRCGTSFMFVIIIISILVSSLPVFTWENTLLRFLTKLAFLPVIIGLGYEFIMFAGKHDNFVTRILSAPGLLMQRITTREPDLQQIEVAIHALKSSMPDEFPDYVKPNAEESEKTDGELTSEDAEQAEAPDKCAKSEQAEMVTECAKSEQSEELTECAKSEQAEMITEGAKFEQADKSEVAGEKSEIKQAVENAESADGMAERVEKYADTVTETAFQPTETLNEEKTEQNKDNGQ